MKPPQRLRAAEGAIHRILGTLNKGNPKMKETPSWVAPPLFRA